MFFQNAPEFCASGEQSVDSAQEKGTIILSEPEGKHNQLSNKQQNKGCDVSPVQTLSCIPTNGSFPMAVWQFESRAALSG